MADDKAMDSFLSELTSGLEEPKTTTDDENVQKEQAADGAPEQNGSEITTDTTPEAQTQPASEETKPETNVDVEETFNKSNKAFAEMRVQNKQTSEFIIKLAKAAGYADVRNAQEAIDKLNANLTTIEAKNKNIDPVILQQLQEKEAKLAEIEKQQLRNEARTGFDKLKATFGLDDKGLYAFAEQLQTAGINPFESKVDLEREYKVRNFDRLIAAAKEAGRQEEITRRTKAQTHSTTPGSKVGGSSDTGESINSVEALRAFLKDK